MKHAKEGPKRKAAKRARERLCLQALRYSDGEADFGDLASAADTYGQAEWDAMMEEAK